MSLQVWLPLNGDLHNQGLRQNLNIIGINITFSNNGKIGKCADFNGTSSRIYIPNFSIDNQWSYGCWVNTPTSDTRGWELVIILNNSGSDADSQLAFWIHQKENRIESLANTKYTSTIPYTPYYNSWHHFFATYNGTVLTSYIDGTVVKTQTITDEKYTGTNLTIGARCTAVNGSSFSSFFQGSLNDVRIYDHCLSIKEVKEIAKGLVLHYKLDNNGLGNPNLVRGNYSAITTATTNNVSGTLSFDTSIISLNDLKGKTLYFSYDYSVEGAKLYNNTGDYTKDRYGIHGNLSYVDSSGTTKTIYPFAGYLTASGTGRAIQSYIVPADARQINSLTFGLQPFNKPAANSTATWYIKNCKLEIGRATSYTPNQNDIHQNSSIIYDSSGYGNNGTIVGSLETITPSPRYNCATKLNKSRINSIKGFPSGPNPDFTITFWVKLFSSVTYTSYTDLIYFTDNDDIGQGGFRLELCGTPPGDNLMWFRGLSGQNGGGFVMNNNSSSNWFSKDTWHQIGLSGKGSTKQYICYFDGEQCGNYNGSANSWTPSGEFRLGDTQSTIADFSDFRIYATALTAAQIKELYTTSMIVNGTSVAARDLE